MDLGTIPIDLKEESTATLPVPGTVPEGADEVTFDVRLATGFGPPDPVSVPVQ